ncbi:AraC family transcriptional regulator [Spiroplasma chinense]|uniref:AraC family transcriptional regulator n=1 Tax=Spiroplasma chinense TaxID=216932 RepID=A0A5B9Y3Q3_9MOLU|nr:helix-turn-helix domain-containing protein [Spiroplasma chinense]QEH61651.1 AraC family transcriptional regulator [Spiroplasma chinense]
MKKISTIEYNKIKNKEDLNAETFYFGNTNTEIFCMSTCDLRLPQEKNFVLFDSKEDALAEKYKPCKKCQLTKIGNSYTKQWREELKVYIDKYYYYDINLEDLSKQIGVSKFHLVRSFKSKFSISPINYLIKVRLVKANEILMSGDKSISEIAYEVGFKSYHHFLKSYKKRFNEIPTATRKIKDPKD